MNKPGESKQTPPPEKSKDDGLKTFEDWGKSIGKSDRMIRSAWIGAQINSGSPKDKKVSRNVFDKAVSDFRKSPSF